ncbi:MULTISPECIES: phasin family protein [Bradyrhizobium]|uniref:phasin family protein n=1 Tax=Bradyrhizobium TaxID=374 RepID=UPI001EDA4040|nr:phasin family protein [Bradyrhizobium zhengyangense]MCG2645796.1 phasin family protein [Bradyrhizobium zhengyangense]
MQDKQQKSLEQILDAIRTKEAAERAPPASDSKQPPRKDARQLAASSFPSSLYQAHMHKQSLEIPSEIRDLVEKSLDQTEKAFEFFFQAAKPAAVDLRLAIAQQNIKTAFEYARKLSRAETLAETIALQAEFFRVQIASASEFMRDVRPKSTGARDNLK